jgi:hypothetical protein
MFPFTDVTNVCYETVLFSPEREPYHTRTPAQSLTVQSLRTGPQHPSLASEERLNTTGR